MEFSAPMAVALVSGAAVGAGIAIYLARTARLRAGPRRHAAVVLAVAASLGTAVVIGELASRPPTPQEIDARRNPFPPTRASLALGGRIYRAQCAVCHGTDGYGNGPAAATLYPPPTDFVVHFASGHVHTDGRLYYWITHGIAGTAMPAFGDRLSETERWYVVNFIRTFTPAER